MTTWRPAAWHKPNAGGGSYPTSRTSRVKAMGSG